MESTEEKPETKIELKKEIGAFQGIGIIVGIMIGSGIFVSPVGVLRATGSVGMSLIMWSVTALVCLIGALVYAALGVQLPVPGGEYSYILEAFGPFLAFIAFWITYVVIGAASIAAKILIFAAYLLRPIYYDCDPPSSIIKLVAFSGLLLLCFVNSYRMSWATKFSIVFTFCKVSALLLIIGFGSYYLIIGNTTSFQHAFEGTNSELGALIIAILHGYWAFAGWNYINFMASEVKNPSRNIPIIIVCSLLMVSVIYLFANVAYLAVLSPREMISSSEGSAAVAVTFASRCMGSMAWIMPAFVGLSVIGSTNGEIISMSRLAFKAGEEGHLPAIFAMINIRTLTPIPSVLAVVLLAICFQFFENISFLIELSGLAFILVSGMAVCSLLRLGYVKGRPKGTGFSLPIVIPLLYLGITIFITGITIYDSPLNACLSLGVMATAVPVYLIFIVWKSKPKAWMSAMAKFTTFVQKLLLVVPSEEQ